MRCILQSMRGDQKLAITPLKNAHPGRDEFPPEHAAKIGGKVEKFDDGGLKPLKAFTLLELICVLLIIVFLLGLNIPSFREHLRNARVKSFINKTYLYIDYAQTCATLRNTVLEVSFDADESRISLSKKGDEENAELRNIIVPENINVEFSREKIIFYPDGTSQEFTINISDSKGKHFEITSEGFDGKIIIKSI